MAYSRASARRTSRYYPNPVVLVPRAYFPHPEDRYLRRLMAGILMFVSCVLVIYVIWDLPNRGDIAWTELWKAFWLHLLEDWHAKPLSPYLLLFFLPVVALFQFALNDTRERVRLSVDGVEFQSGTWKMFQRFKPSWSLAWEDIEHVGVKQGNDHILSLLLLSRTGKRYKLRASQWVDPKYPVCIGGWRALFPPLMPHPDERGGQGLRASVIYDYLVDAGIAIDLSGEHRVPVAGFDLTGDARTASLLWLLAIIVFAAFFGYIESNEDWPSGAGGLGIAFVFIGGVAGILLGVWLARAGVPRFESVGLGIVSGAVVCGALYPLSLYVNAMGDEHGLRPYTYLVRPGQGLEPTRTGMPWIRKKKSLGHWHQFTDGAEYRIWMRKGGLGVWQFDSERLMDEVRESQLRRR